MPLSGLPLGAESVRGLFAWPGSMWQKLREGDCGKQRATVLQIPLEKGVGVFSGCSGTGNGEGGALTIGCARHFEVLDGGGRHELLAFPCGSAPNLPALELIQEKRHPPAENPVCFVCYIVVAGETTRAERQVAHKEKTVMHIDIALEQRKCIF